MDPYLILLLIASLLGTLIGWMWRKSRLNGPAGRTPPPGAKATGLRLVCTQGPLAGRSFPFRRPSLTIGRERDNDVVIDGSLVSRHHAMVTAGANGVVLSDLGSTNGTWCAGRRVLEQPLAENEAFQIGPCVFNVVMPGGYAEPQPASRPISRPVASVSMSMARSVEIASYEQLELIGEGGAAYVYKMRHRRTNELAALKLLKESADPYFKQRFAEEGLIGRRLTHPHIVTVLGAGESQGVHYILMEYLPGLSLREQLRGPMELNRAIPVIGQIAEALDFAHAFGIFHRDIKPENILFTDSGLAKLGDFGIARLTGMRRITREGMLIGTPEYMSFEQAKGLEPDGRSDQYSLAVVLYEMLTGRQPFVARDPLAVVEKHLSHAPQPPRALNPSIPPHVERVILRSLEKDRRNRYPTMAAMSAALGYKSAAAAQPVGRPPVAPIAGSPLPGGRLVHSVSGRVWPLTQPTLELGRELLGDPAISRRHARIQQRGQVYLLEDLGSRNGTFIDGRRVASHTPVVLASGARVHLGPVSFQFIVDELPSIGR